MPKNSRDRRDLHKMYLIENYKILCGKKIFKYEYKILFGKMLGLGLGLELKEMSFQLLLEI